MKGFKKEVDKYLTIENMLWIFLILLPFLLKDSVIKESIQTHYFDYFKPTPFLVLIELIIILWYIKSNLKTKTFIFKWFFPVCLWINLYMPKEGNGTFLIVLIDILFCVLILWAIFDVLKPDRYNPELNQGLISDDPIEKEDEGNNFGRTDYAKSIVAEIAKTVNKRAFNIAITGAWGSGKTSFLNLIKGEMDKEVDDEKVKFITVNYNPWDFKEDKIIGLDLLKTISHELANEKELQEKFKGLMVSLQGVDESPWYKVIPNLLIGFSIEKTINDYREEIGKALQNQDKKLVIFLDDLDRLDGDEILEVFKTIRNSFDIANTFFILGFDIDYVIDQIKNKVNGNDQNVRALEYLEKIFQMRLNMPSNTDFDFVRLLEEKLERRVNETIVKVLDFIFKDLRVRDIISITNAIKVFNQSTKNDQDYDFDAKLLLQMIALKYPEMYNYLSGNYPQVVNETVKQHIFNGHAKPIHYLPYNLETVKISNYNDNEKKLILFLVYFMTPYGSKEPSKDIYNSYFKIRIPDHLVSRSGLYVAISENDQDFINKHLDSEKETDLFANLEMAGKDYKRLDDDQIDFIVKNLIMYHSRLFNSVKSYSQLFKTNLFDFPTNSYTHNTLIANKSVYTNRKFLNYIEEFDIDTQFNLIAKFWYLDDVHLNRLELELEKHINDKSTDCGYVFYLLYSYIWPKGLNWMYKEKLQEITNFRERILDKIQNHFIKDPINCIKPFVFAQGLAENGFSYNDALGSVEFILSKLNPEEIQQKELIRWLRSGPFIGNDKHNNFYPLNYKYVFGEEYDTSIYI
jgi:hypothetical protein